ncbi:hypothetical protein HS088_TW13G00755 [Tripterygium wilfordii]|uniref:Transcription factor CBF/NF-Y/archaeal histone domain-containing protein n=1 Tax=Tripterygium wilfordii TaxID=458696 RepID=A0A7J7CV07_TRIWF|nr:nuclear transcription factor Y subunit B-3-like [Tripterygium wilfordii]KAF5737864.1 hypothetical protein HS088_TW13G00755 [Tripterygium wilfordii]
MARKRSQTSSLIGSPSSDNSSSTKLDHDRFLPIANVSRIMKKSLPANANISKEAKEIVQECVSEFISFITGEASDKCQREKRKTINGDDLLWAMTTLGFENYVVPLKVYLNKYREIEGEKNFLARQEDQSPTNTNEIMINKVKSPISANRAEFQGFNGGLLSLGAQVTPKRFEFGENFVNLNFNMSRVCAKGDGHGNRAFAVAAPLHHGLEW